MIRLLYERNWPRERIVVLFNVLDWMMSLPDAMNDQVWQDIEAFEGSQGMRYISSVEKIGLRKGFEKGITKGIEKGRGQMLRDQLIHRFGPLPQAVAGRIESGTTADLNRWGRRILEARTLDDVFLEEVA